MQGQRFQSLRLQLKSSLFKQEPQSPLATPERQKLEKDRQKLIDKIETKFQTTPLKKESITPPLQKTKKLKKDNLEFSSVYEELELVGQGGHAVVKKCRKIADPSQIYAVKIYRTGDPEIINTIQQAYQNKIMVQHPNCCSAQELFIDENQGLCYMVQEYCPWESLEQVLREQTRLTYEQALKIMEQILDTLVYIHYIGICHRDIKPDNILVNLDASPQIKLIDFGVSSRFLEEKTREKKLMWTRTGNIFYQAPESFEITGYDERVDIWSSGIVFYQMIFGELPFMNDEIVETIDLIQNSDLDEERLSTIPKLMRDFLRRTLCKKPSARLDAKECLLHPVFRQEQEEKPKSVKDDVSIDLGPANVDKPDYNAVDDLSAWFTPCNKTSSNNLVGQSLKNIITQKPIHHIEKVKRNRFRAYSLKQSNNEQDQQPKINKLSKFSDNTFQNETSDNN